MHKKVNKLLATFASALVLLSGIGITPIHAEGEKTNAPTLNPDNDHQEFVNNIDSGLVAIEIGQIKATKKTVVPNQFVNDVYTVKNNAEEAWIRCKVRYQFDDEVNEYSSEDLKVHSEDWVEIGDYWYYKSTVQQGETVTFLDGERMPMDFTNEDSSKPYKVIVNVDAVQARNFTPNWESDYPWYGTIIEYSIRDWYTRNDGYGEQNFEVQFLGGAEGLVRRGDDLFSSWDTVMPGDVLTDSLVVGNHYNQPVNMYFRVDHIDSENWEMLADHTGLKIWAGVDLIYDGTISGAMDEKLLANMAPGYEALLKFEIRVPDRLDNPYALKEAYQRWIFRAELPQQTRKLVNTGTGDKLMLFGGIAIVAVGLLSAVIIEKKKKSQ